MVALTRPGAVPVLSFHDIGTPDARFSTELFRTCLRRLRDAGCRGIDLATFIDALDRRSELPDNPVLISFDDGYRSTYEVAFPLLLEYGFRACLFVITGSDRRRSRLPRFEGRDMLSWSELGEMRDAGFSIGSHTMTHPDLTRLTDDRAVAELRGSKQLLEDRLGIAVDGCAYPYGRHDARSRSIAGECYRCAFTDILGVIDAHSDRFQLRRIDMCFFDRRPLLRLLTGPLLAPYLYLQNRRVAASRRLFGAGAPA